MMANGPVTTTCMALVVVAALATATVSATKTRVVRTTKAGIDMQLRINEPTLCAPDVQQYSGYFDVGLAHYFFWFFESRNDPATDPFVTFHNGGPGCSSMVGNLAEKIGPCTINSDLSEEPNPYTWINHANMIFIDAPAGAGYSYTDGNFTVNSRQYADDVYAFFQLFFGTFPKYQRLPFHIFGESYAGHYIPALATRIIEGNAENSTLKINLHSIAPGNALVDPLSQYPTYPKMACNNSYGIQVFSQRLCDFMDSRMPACVERIQKCYDEDKWAPCVWSGLSCNFVMITPIKLVDTNPYDIRIPCESGNLCYDFSAMEEYLMSDYVREQLGVTKKRYTPCNYRINLAYQLIYADWMRNYMKDVQPLLDNHNIRMLVFSGDADFIVNWYGSLDFVNRLQWSGGDAFRSTPMRQWLYRGTPAGEVQAFGALTFLRVYEAGHMVPMDQPERALDMFARWLRNEPFAS